MLKSPQTFNLTATDFARFAIDGNNGLGLSSACGSTNRHQSLHGGRLVGVDTSILALCIDLFSQVNQGFQVEAFF